MDRKKAYKQSSIKSFFSKKPAPSSQKANASATPLAESSFNSVISSQSSLGELPERKRPDRQEETAAHGSPFPLRGPPPSSNPHIQDDPTCITVATSPADGGSFSSSALTSLDIAPASSISLGHPTHIDTGSSFSASTQVPTGSADPSASQSSNTHTLGVPGWSTPSRPSTPPQVSVSYSGEGTPTRTLFTYNDGGSTASKRTANMASFSPMKARPPTKIAKKSPTPSLRAPSDASPFSSTPQIPSSPTSPVAKKAAFDRTMEIKGSDDEDDDMSDESLPDIDSFVPSKILFPEKPASTKIGAATPEGRRTRRTGLLQSPVAMSNKTRKFDIKTLIAHQKTDDAIAAGFKRATEEMEQAAMATATKREMESKSVVTNSPSTIRKQFISMAGVKEETAGKALRAMERTQYASLEQTAFYFFKANHSSSTEKPRPFPKAAAQGPWALLAKEGTRRRQIESGFFSKVARQLTIPDDIFLWLLDSMRTEKSPVVRSAYCEILAGASSEQVQRLVKPEKLSEICHGLGCIESFDDDQLQSVAEREGGYADRDWGSLLTHLQWLREAAPFFGQDVIQHAVGHLLRMATDRALLSNPDVLLYHQAALTDLVDHVEAPMWDEFCEQTASALYRAFGIDHLLVLPLQSCSAASDRIRQLQRRLARGFFLGDPSKARQHPDQGILLSEMIDRLGHDEFKITRKTDYLRLRARMRMLDIAIDDGSQTQREGGAEGDERFNEDIDEVSRRLRDIWGSINDAGALYLTRTQAKSTIDCMQKRLTYSERTKPIPKQSLFDLPGKVAKAPSADSQALMQRFISNLKKARPAITPGKTPEGSDGGSSDAEATFMTAMGDD